MIGFQAQKGFVHFVFANEQDHYLLPSLVRLDLNGYLYCRLREQGYEGVYFIGGTREDYSLSVYDQPSRELFQKYGKKGGVFKGIFGADEEDNGRTYSLPSPAESARRINTMLKKGCNQAFVFHADTFREIYGKQRQELEEFLKAGNHSPEQGGNILVLLMPPEESGAGSWLTDPQGVFSLCCHQELCPEQQEYSIGDRVVTLNTFSYEQMYLAARWLYLTARQDWDWQNQDVQDLAAFLHAWYASGELRKQTGPLLSENETHRFDLLLRDLTDAALWENLRAAMEEIKQKAGAQSLGDYMRQLIHPEPAGEALSEEEPLRNI